MNTKCWEGRAPQEVEAPILALCLSPIWLLLNCIIYNKLVNISKVFFWVLWDISSKLCNLSGREGAVVGTPEFVVGQTEVWVAWADHVQLESEMQPVLWNWALSLVKFDATTQVVSESNWTVDYSLVMEDLRISQPEKTLFSTFSFSGIKQIRNPRVILISFPSIPQPLSPILNQVLNQSMLLNFTSKYS